MPSYYEGLPIYKAVTDLVVLLDKVVRGFSRYHKYTLGARMRETAIDVAMLVARANRREDRARLVPDAECTRWQDARALGLRLGRCRHGRRRAGMPWRMVSGLIRRGLQRGLRIAVAFEEPFASGNVKARRLAYWFESVHAPGKAALGPGDVDSSGKARKEEGGHE